MAAINKISINAEAAYSVMTYVANATTMLQNDVSEKLSSSFEPLESLGLLSESLSTIKEQVKTIENAGQSIVNEIGSHIQTVGTQEQNLLNAYNNRNYGGNNYTGGPTYSSPDASYQDTLDNVDDGLKISTKELQEILLNLDDDYIKDLIELINTNKGKGTSLVELLLDNSNSEKLFKALKDAFGDKINIDDISIEDYKEIQKTLLDAIVKSKIDIPSLNDKSILSCKEYLYKVCKENNINPSDLFFDDKYSMLLKTTIKKMYDGNVGNTLDQSKLDTFKSYIDQLSKKNKVNVDELINNYLDKIK